MVVDLILILIPIGIALGASAYIKSTGKKMSKITNSKGLTGEEVARKLLDENGLTNSYVVKIDGVLTDHYDSKRKVVRLSTAVYEEDSITSIAVAAHEVGHAIQDKQDNLYYKIRQMLAPIASISSKGSYVAIIIGLIAGMTDLLWLGIFLLGAVLIFQIATLPVEFGASKLALDELEKNKMMTNKDKPLVEKMLKAAAYTYVAAVIATAINMLRLILLSRS